MFFNHAQKGIQLLVEQGNLMAQFCHILNDGLHLGPHLIFAYALLRKLTLNEPTEEPYDGGEDRQRPRLPPGLHSHFLRT
jgi:hypothetical protein